jgi:ATP synthase I chain
MMTMELSERFYEAVERRIERLTLLIGVVGGIYAASKWGWRSGVGFAAGSFLSWLNFRWLSQGIGGLLRAAMPQGGAEPYRVSPLIYARFFARMALLVAAVYAILKIAWFPGRSILAGLFSLIAAVILEVTYEVATGFSEPRPRS